jgi:cysteine desulfurase/selenocysteine lyase
MPADSMISPKRLYLDNAATSFPKPACVHEAMLRYATEIGASPGRGAYAESREGANLLWRCRDALSRFFNHGGPSHTAPEHVIFTLNTSDALNLAIKGVIRRALREDPSRRVHAVTTDMDHNSVLRPFNALAQTEPRFSWTAVAADPLTGLVDPDDLRAALTPETELVATVHASNVTGTVQPLAAFGAICRAAGVTLLVDAAQSAGHTEVDCDAMGIDLLAVPGHKGLLGPLGTGALLIRPGLEHSIDPLREGGTGSVSESAFHPETMPDRFEPGSHNTPGIVGLGAALDWLINAEHQFGAGIDAIFAHERRLTEVFIDAWHAVDAPGLRLLGPQTTADRLGVFSVVHDVLGPHELAMILESEHGVLTRSGIHCAPHAHNTLGTTDRGGATRLSVGAFVTEDDVRTAVDALGSICRAMAQVS